MWIFDGSVFVRVRAGRRRIQYASKDYDAVACIFWQSGSDPYATFYLGYNTSYSMHTRTRNTDPMIFCNYIVFIDGCRYGMTSNFAHACELICVWSLRRILDYIQYAWNLRRILDTSKSNLREVYGAYRILIKWWQQMVACEPMHA